MDHLTDMNQKRNDTTTEDSRFEVKFDARKLSMLNLALGFLIIAILCFLFFHFVIGTARVSGSSMEPSLSNGQIVAYSKLSDSPAAGDIVALSMPSGEHYIKRVIAVPGDVVDIEGSTLTVNGVVPDTQTLTQGETLPSSSEIDYPYVVKDGMYFVMGDNREHSLDSRSFGAVSAAQIDGIVLGK